MSSVLRRLDPTLLVQQHVLARTEAKLEPHIFLKELHVALGLDSLVVDVRPVGRRFQVNEVGTDSVASPPSRRDARIGYEAELEDGVLFGNRRMIQRDVGHFALAAHQIGALSVQVESPATFGDAVAVVVIIDVVWSSLPLCIPRRTIGHSATGVSIFHFLLLLFLLLLLLFTVTLIGSCFTLTVADPDGGAWTREEVLAPLPPFPYSCSSAYASVSFR